MSARILVLEDDDTMREQLLDILSMDDHLVDGACEPAQAVELARKHKYDLMLSDIRMAGPTDGLGAVAYIKEKLQSQLLVVMITGFADENAPRRALDIAVDAYLYKNQLTVKDTLRIVDGLLKQRTQKGFLEQLLEPLWAKPKQLLQAHQEKQKAQQEEQLAKAKDALDQAKLDAYKRLTVAIMSGNILMAPSLDIWDILVELDKQYVQANNLNEMRAVFNSYQKLREEIATREAKNELSMKPREPHQLTRPQWKIIFDKVKKGDLSAMQLQFAEKLRQLAPEERQKNPRWHAMYQVIWG
jgi:DNA-binding NarL/FixJ family response regulator